MAIATAAEETGAFRTSFRGFHKEDVLAYIDAQQAHHGEELDELRRQLEEAEQRAAETADKLEEAQRLNRETEEQLRIQQVENAQAAARAEEAVRGLEEARRQVEAAEDVRRENRRLEEKIRLLEQEVQAGREKSAAGEAEWQRRAQQAETGLSEARAAAAKAQEEADQLRRRAQENSSSADQLRRQLDESRAAAASWEASSRRYEQLVGDVGGFIMEIRAMGQRFLETSYKRSEGCLDALDDAVNALERQLADNRADVEQARQELLDSSAAAGLRMEDLLQELEEAGERACQPDEKSGDDSGFFR